MIAYPKAPVYLYLGEIKIISLLFFHRNEGFYCYSYTSNYQQMKNKFMAVFLLLSLSYSTTLPAQDNDSLTRIYSKFDFVPGEKVIFYDDFSQDNVGDFPALWNTTGSGEVVNYGKYPGKWFHITNNRGVTTTAETLTLPEKETRSGGQRTADQE